MVYAVGCGKTRKRMFFQIGGFLPASAFHEAVFAVDWLAFCGLERHLARLSAFAADGVVHFTSEFVRHSLNHLLCICKHELRMKNKIPNILGETCLKIPSRQYPIGYWVFFMHYLHSLG